VQFGVAYSRIHPVGAGVGVGVGLGIIALEIFGCEETALDKTKLETLNSVDVSGTELSLKNDSD